MHDKGNVLVSACCTLQLGVFSLQSDLQNREVEYLSLNENNCVFKIAANFVWIRLASMTTCSIYEWSSMS